MDRQIGFIGLGNMGCAMAQNIQKHLDASQQRPLKVWNRTASRAEPVITLGGVQCNSIAELTQQCDLIFISSSDDTAVEAIVDQIISSGDIKDKIIIDTTTIHPDTTKAISGRIKAASGVFAAIPVFGATPIAQAGQLLAIFSGPEIAFDAASPFLKGVIARDVLRVSDVPEKATLVKTCGNFLTAGMMELVAEAHVFAEKTELGDELLAKLLELNFGPLMHAHSTRMTSGVYMPARGEAPRSDLNLALKDVGHGVDYAARAGTRLRVGELALEHLKRAKSYADEHGRAMDSSSMYGVIRQDAGLNFESDVVKERDGQ